MKDNLIARKSPCENCPWRKDVEPGEFTVERYKALAASATDMSHVIFTCHKSDDVTPVVCAGFLARGAIHNLAIRMAYAFKRLKVQERSGGCDLYDSYSDMAKANGVDPDADELKDTR